MLHSLCFIYGQILLQCLSRTQNLAAHYLKKGCWIASFLSLLKRDDTIFSFSYDLFLMLQGHSVSSNRDTRGRILNKAKRIVNAINEEPPWKILSRKSRSLTWGWTDPYFLHWFGTHFFHRIFFHSLHFIIFEQFRFYNPIKTILTYLQHLHQ